MEPIITIDIGNTRAKYAIFEGDKIVESGTFSIGGGDLRHILNRYPNIKRGILATVRGHVNDIIDQAKPVEIVNLTHKLKLPFKIGTDNASEIGADILASTAVAAVRFKGQNVLVIDAGSCITYQIINAEGVFEGCVISPGIQMRLKAMKEYTALLPLVEVRNDAPLVGTNTISCIQSGVSNGVKAEIEGLINRFSEKYENMIVFVGGGDNNFFDKKLKNKIFADPNLVMEGLRIILDYNS